MAGLAQQVDVVVQELLPDEPAEWCRRYQSSSDRKGRIIHDAVWGTIFAHNWECALIDTPLIQRLRRIHQTGATHLIYPSARHTRFEHTLGVMHQAGKMCNALAENGERHRIEGVTYEARMAAILHDTGHGPYSHTSEQYYSIHSSLDEYREESSRFSGSGAGELLSCLIVTSPSLKKFIDAINDVFRVNFDTEKIAGYISGTLSGSERFKSEIIHGPFDADKLDYMFRDGHFTGLQVPIDLDRLFYSIGIKAGGEMISPNRGADQERVVRLCGRASAASPLMQIAFNKMMLFAGVYHHHKVRAVDCMLWSIFEMATQQNLRLAGTQIESVSDYLKITDDQLLIPELSDDALKPVIEGVRNRRLWKRALVISRATVEDSSLNTETGHGTYYNVLRLSENTREAFEEKRRIAGLIAKEANVPENVVWFDVPKPPSATEAKDMWLDAPNGNAVQRLGDVMPISQWVEIYSNTRHCSHVFCPEENRGEVNKAAIEVLQSELGVGLKSDATDLAKL